MAERDIALFQENASGVWVRVTLSPTAAKHAVVLNGSGVPAVVASPAAPSDGATDADTSQPAAAGNPPTKTEYDALVTAYNACATKYNALATEFNALVDKLQTLNLLQ